MRQCLNRSKERRDDAFDALATATASECSDPAFKEQREKQTRAMEEKLAGGRRGENKWLLLDRLKNESWATQGLVSEEYRLFLVLLEWRDDG